RAATDVAYNRVTMKVLSFLLLVALAVAKPQNQTNDAPEKAQLDEDFGYVTVRTGSHMFYVVYHVDQPGDWTTYPLIMWLQGGPGSSGVGYGNLAELGPYDVNGNKRDGAWTKKANVMFVDNPVGTGYSYVDNFDYLCEDEQCIANDLVELVKGAMEAVPDLQKMPFYAFSESYGGKMVTDFALAFDAAIKNGDVVSDFQGIGIGDAWVSPMDSVNTWGEYLYNMGFVNEEGRGAIDAAAATTQGYVDNGQWGLATNAWSYTEGVVMQKTDGVNFYNVLTEEDVYRKNGLKPHSRDLSYMRPEVRELYKRHVHRYPRNVMDVIYDLMNGEYADRWNIPANVEWDGQGGYVFDTLSKDFMKPVIDSVSQILDTTDIHVAVYNGNLDLICDSIGTWNWVKKLTWGDMNSWYGATQKSLYISDYSSVAAYYQRANQFSVFSILRSGHMVPEDAPSTSLAMIDLVTQWGAEAKEAAKAKKNMTSPITVTKEEPKQAEAVAAPKKVQHEEAVTTEAEEAVVVKSSPVRKSPVAPIVTVKKVKKALNTTRAKVARVGHLNPATPTGKRFAHMATNARKPKHVKK
ncbi:unnamed protein product, partial [Meganyctiphanes norvegica]